MQKQSKIKTINTLDTKRSNKQKKITREKGNFCQDIHIMGYVLINIINNFLTSEPTPPPSPPV